MNEALLMYAWKFRCFRPAQLKTTEGTEITILKPGKENTDAGPDFFMSELKLGDTHWVGNVEIHVKSSDWNLHQHQHDPSYNNVILHVVYIHDKEIDIVGKQVPTLQLKDYLPADFLERFRSISNGSGQSIPCEKLLSGVAPIHINSCLSRMLVERLIQRTEQIKFLYDSTNQNLLETFYQWLFIGFGQKVNKEAFHQLARTAPFSLVKKHTNELIQIEAMLFGVSGLLPISTQDEYLLKLNKIYNYQRQKHGLEELPKSVWKFLRMRPSNFPTLRIAQLSQLLRLHPALETLFTDDVDEKSLALQMKVELHPFWQNRFSFETSPRVVDKQTGKDFIKHLQLNVIIPFRYFRAHLIGENEVDEMERMIAALPPEKNSITRKMEKAGFENTNAAKSQALIQLHNLYCEEKKCLLCSIGYQILRT